MLDHECKDFLVFLNANQPDYEDQVYTYEWLDENYQEPIETVYRMVRYLEKNDYIKIATLNGSSFGIALEQKGYCFEEYETMSTFNFFCKSVLTPIVVSVATTLITLWLQSKL